jgi:hypothetical protein
LQAHLSSFPHSISHSNQPKPPPISLKVTSLFHLFHCDYYFCKEAYYYNLNTFFYCNTHYMLSQFTYYCKSSPEIVLL